jgi:GDP-L-fucose synthase
VFLAAAKVGGIWANQTFPAEFIYSNLSIEVNVIHAAYKFGVKKLLFLGSSCIYPKHAPQPMKEKHLLTSPLEPTNEAYAVAKIAGLKMCRYYNEQYGSNFISVMPTNLYGPNDNYDLKTSHVLPALIRKMVLARCLDENDWNGIREDLKKNPIKGVDSSASEKEIKKILEDYGITAHEDVTSPLTNHESRINLELWGTGSARREFLHVDDLASAVVFLMEKFDYKDIGEIINIGTGQDLSIRELAEKVKEIVGFNGTITWDTTKPDGNPRKLLDVSKLSFLGWKPKISLDEGISRNYQNYISSKK